MNYIPININTHYELLSSLIKIDDLISFCLSNSIKCIGITDTNMYSFMEAYTKCKSNGIKLITGIYNSELDIYIYCVNYDGYTHLCNIISNNLSLEEIISFDNIVIVCSLSNYNDINFNNKYIGYTTQSERENALLLTNKVVYNPKMLCFNKEDNEYLRYVYAIKNKLTIDEVNTSFNNHYMTCDDIDAKSTVSFSEMFNLELPKTERYIPKYIENDKEFLKNLCFKGINKRLNNNVSNEYIDRLNYELSVIDKMGFTSYFLIVYDYVLFAKKNNIMVGAGRGSASGSLVSYSIGITEVDPIKYNLIFERFLNPDRQTMPDIDVDFDSEKRDIVVSYVKNKYGIENTANIITFDTMLPKQVLRDTSKVLNIYQAKVDRICKLINKEKTIEELNNNKDFMTIINRDSELKNLCKIASKLCNLKKNTSIHAAGIVISSIPLYNLMPVIKKDGLLTTCYTMEYIESFGLLKMDFLSLNNLTTIFNILKKLNSNNINININKIPLDDKKTLDLFRLGKTSGIFQFESFGMINLLKKSNIKSIKDLINLIALYRPGPMNMIDTYIKRSKGEKIIYEVKELESILSDTYGIIIFQEQVLEILRTIGGFSYAQSDIIRRAMSKKKYDLIINEKETFINGVISKGYSMEIGEDLFNKIIEFSSYGFNKSHSVVYTIIAYQMAYLKAHFPLYFMSYVLNSNKASEKIKEYIYECKTYNINILGVNINYSTSDYEIINNNLFMPFTGIKGISKEISDLIIGERETSFSDFYDFMYRCYKKIINKKVIISLIEVGAFDVLNLNKKETINNLDIIINYINLCFDLGIDNIDKPILINYNEYSSKELANFELTNYGYYLSIHPVSLLDRNGCTISKDISKYIGKTIKMVLLVDNIKVINTKNNEKMCFLTLSDEYSNIDAVMFPSVYKNVFVEIGKIYMFVVKIEKTDKISLIVNNAIIY